MVPDATAASTPVSDIGSESVEIRAETDDQLSDLDSEMEPEQMTERYLELRTRLFQLDPGASAQGGKSRKGQEKKKDIEPPNTNRSKKAARIQSQISKITSDILFDKPKADMIWQSEEIVLRKESAECRRLDRPQPMTPEAKSTGSLEEEENNEEDELIVGDLFGSLPAMSGDKIAGTDAIRSTSAPGDNKIRILDFGRWTGIGPRRVLEEACKAR